MFFSAPPFWSSRGGEQEYFFTYPGGVFSGTAPSFIPEFLEEDTANTPVWWDEAVAQEVTVYGDEAATYVSSVLLPFTTGNNTIHDLLYPANFGASYDDVGPSIYFYDSTQQVAPALGTGAAIDYTANPSEVYGLTVAVPGTLSEFHWYPTTIQGWFEYDDYGGANIVYFAAAFLLGDNQITSGITYGHLLISVINRSGSTITEIDADGIGTSIQIATPAAVDPDDIQDDEYDISFVGGTPACAVHNAGSLTLTVGGDRHTLEFKFSGATITDNSTARFVFPVELKAGANTGFFGTAVASVTAIQAVPVLVGDDYIVTDPATNVKFFTDSGDTSKTFLEYY